MNLSHKLTFSLACFIVLFAFAVMPAMAETIEATWVVDIDDGTTGNQNGWDITIGGLANSETIEVTAVVQGGAALASGTDFTAFPAAASDGTTSESSIPAAIGTVIAVGVRNTTSGQEANYQRVTFPAGGTGATLASTPLTLVPKLTKLTTPNYYVNFTNNMATVMFNFEAAMADSHGAPTAMLHVSDVTVTPDTNWQIVGVSGTNMVMLRATHATTAVSQASIVSLDIASDTASGFALAADAADPVNVPGNGTARIYFDNTAPTAAVPAAAPTDPPVPYPLRAVSLSTDFAAPEVDEDTVWDEDFYLRVLINDDDPGGGVEFTDMMVSFDKANKLEVVQVGMDANQAGAADADTNDGVYLIHLRLLPNRVTTAGEEVVIIITPVDMSGNPATAPARQTVKLAQMDAPVVQPNRAPNFGANTIQDITAQATVTAINVTLPAAVDPDGNNITYTLTGLPAGLSFNAGTRVLSGTPSAMSAQATYTYTATDNGSPAMSASLTFMITVSAAPVAPDLHETEMEKSSAAITIPANSFVVVVRDRNDANNPVEGLAFRADVAAKVVEWPGMPNLERLFYRGTSGVILDNGGGGALILHESAAQTKDRRHGSVGISEIMWGIDEGHLGNEANEKSAQWIELHNLNAMVADNPDTMDVNEADDGVAKVYLSWKTGRDITSDSTITGNLANPVLDVVTNYFNNRPGGPAWNVEDKGSSGNSVAGKNFVSMARILPHQRSAYANADGARYDNRDGRNAGHWGASTAAYLTARTTRADANDVVYNYVGTPGRVNHVSVQNQPHVRKGREFKPASNNIVINEVGNSSDDRYDWIELRNASGGEINLKNYLITKVTAVDTETVMARFPANDNVKLQPNEVFLLLRTDPANDPDHPIAATGYNVDKPLQEQVPGTLNSPVRYKVINSNNFHIPNGQPNIVIMVRKPDSGHNNGPGGHKDQGTSEIAGGTHGPDLHHIVDIAGYHSNLRKSGYPNPVSSTNLWPLYDFADPKFTNNRFDENTVHQRDRTGTAHDRSGTGIQHGNDTGQTAFNGRGWTGVGYRRMAAQTGANGGTPGYPNGANPRSGNAITSAVYISEIMYADDARGSLAQWIELRNPSPTMGADLTNWRLTITNHDSKNEAGDAFTGTSHTEDVMLNGLEIPPNSAVLIVSRSGPRSDVQVPDGHIFVLYPAHRGPLGMANATSDILNPYGFNIRIQANAHDKGKRHEWQMVDEVGNLAARRTASRGERPDTERYDDPRWMWPNAMTEDGARISVARTNKRGGTQATGFTIADGKEASGWILSNMDMRTDLISPTYYGHRDDWSTPGQTKGQPLPVELSFFRPTFEDGKVTIQWTTESELDNAGFNILRSDSRNGEFTKVNEQMIQGKGTTAERTTYKWVDTTAKPGAVYYYQIEDVSFAGQQNTLATTMLKGLISAKGKRTLQWGELKNLR